MPLRVKLDDVLTALESVSDTASSYLNKQTGEIVYITDEEFSAAEANDPLEKYPEWQRELIPIAKEIQETDNYLPLPDEFEIDEYRIMERFCLSIEDDEVSDYLYRSIKGRGAFRRFKDAIHEKGIADDWYKFRNEAYKQIALDWCESHNIEVIM